MHYFVGFLIALAVGLTGVGGGSFTVPALLLLVWIARREVTHSNQRSPLPALTKS